jgi:23S rRNA pseudouridine2457 synthase
MPFYRYFAIYKPYNMLSQFTKEGNHKVLSELYHFPDDIYPVGRLDSDSEGLLLLTNDKKLNHQLLHPTQRHERTYWAQVENIPDKPALQQLLKGVNINVEGKIYTTLPAVSAFILDSSPTNFERNPPIRYRKNIPTAWLSLTLREGKNRQVRKMTAAVGFPTLRLIRYSIEQINIDNMQIGDVVEMSREEIYKKLRLS